MYEQWLCASGHMVFFTPEDSRPSVDSWECSTCRGKRVWAECTESLVNLTKLKPRERALPRTYHIPVVFKIGNWYKRADSPYKCLSLGGIGQYPVILQTASGYLDSCGLKGETQNNLVFRPCDPLHDCKHNMLITTAGVDIQKGKAVIEVMALCSCGKSWKGKTHIKEVK